MACVVTVQGRSHTLVITSISPAADVDQRLKKSHADSVTSRVHIKSGIWSSVKHSGLILVCDEFINVWLIAAAEFKGVRLMQRDSSGTTVSRQISLVTIKFNEQIKAHRELLTDKTFPQLLLRTCTFKSP